MDGGAARYMLGDDVEPYTHEDTSESLGAMQAKARTVADRGQSVTVWKCIPVAVYTATVQVTQTNLFPEDK
jgi:hypothetical protein